MAKKKKRKEEKKLKFKYSVELNGLILILMAILGIGAGTPLGLFGKLSRAFAVFLVGSWDIVLLLLFFILGGYLLIKRMPPRFFGSRAIGFYLVIIGILVYSHINYVRFNNGDILQVFKVTINNLMNDFDFIMRGSKTSISGGGVIGSIGCCC